MRSQQNRERDRREALVSCGEDQCGAPLMSEVRIHTHAHAHLYRVIHAVEGCDLWIQKQQVEKTTETQTGSHPSEY